MRTIYVLKCEQNKYYIGQTNRNLEYRIYEHIFGSGSEWTKKYKPIKIIDIINNCDEMDEDKYTKIYMKKYGIDNVRGGAYVTLILSEDQCKTLNDLLNNKKDYFIKDIHGNYKFNGDICSKCSRYGHTKKTCYSKRTSIKNNECSIL